MSKRMFGSKVKIALMLIFIATMGFAAICSTVSGQFCGPYAGFSPLPVTMATPCGAIASAGGVTACSSIGGAVASAGGIAAGASTLYPAAFAGPVAPCYPYDMAGLAL